jgi:hypothetical protein
MTGMMGAAVLTAGDDDDGDVNADEELEDGEAPGGISFGGTT